MLSYLKKSRVALAAVGLGVLLAGTTALSGTARADWDHGRGHHGGHWDRGDRGGHWGHRHWDRGDHWRGGYYREYYRPHYRYYDPGYVYYSRPYYDDYYYPAYDTYYPAGVSFGFNFR